MVRGFIGKNRKNLSTRVFYFALAAVAALLLLAVAYFYRNLMNPDGVAYMSIASHYVNGYWLEAINSYWSPLLSWLMVPFIWLGASPQVAFSMVNYGASIGTYLLGLFILYKYLNFGKKTFSVVYSLLIIPFLMHAQTTYITPDILVAALVLLFGFVLLWAGEYLQKHTQKNTPYIVGAVIGAVAAICYFAKLFLLPFVVATFLLWVLVVLFNLRKEKNFKTIVVRYVQLSIMTIAAFCVVVAPWAAAMYVKYDTITLGMSAGFNISAKGPGYSGNPINRLVTAPPNEHSVTAWEDPTQLEYEEFTPLGGRDDLVHYITDRAGKLLENVETVAGISFLILIAIVAMVYGFASRKITYINEPYIVVAFLTIFVYWGGYIGIASGNQRYYWALLPPAIIALIIMCSRVLAAAKGRDTAVTALKYSIVITILAVGVTSAFMNFAQKPQRFFAQNVRDPLEGISQNLIDEGLFDHNTRIAGNYLYPTTATAYYANVKSYGVTEGQLLDNKKVREDLRRHDVDYFIVTTEEPLEVPNVGYKDGEVIVHKELECSFDGICPTYLYIIDVREL